MEAQASPAEWPRGTMSRGVAAQVVGAPRWLPNVKHCRWVRDRQVLLECPVAGCAALSSQLLHAGTRMSCTWQAQEGKAC